MLLSFVDEKSKNCPFIEYRDRDKYTDRSFLWLKDHYTEG